MTNSSAQLTRSHGDTVITGITSFRLVAAMLLSAVLLAVVPALAGAAVPDPMTDGPYAATEIPQYKAGTVNLQEPNAAGGSTTVATPNAANAATLQVRGSAWYPANRATPSPVIVLVHGNHGSCDSIFDPVTGVQVPTNQRPAAPTCTIPGDPSGTTYFKRNDRGYAYMAKNLATWGYTVLSVDQDQLIYYQDGNVGKGMHQRRLLIAATLDAFYAANQAAPPATADNNLGSTFVGKLDFTRIGLMGHSRGGDAVTSFIDYNRTRPAPGRRYDLRGVISLAPVDYERRSPYGMPYMTEFGLCDGDVSNMQGARFFERSQYIDMSDPFPRIQIAVQGADHNYYNSVWSADNDDQNGADVACGPIAANADTSIRLSGGTTINGANPILLGASASFLGTYTWANRNLANPALMGEQEKIGLATMNSFFRRYVGGETDFDPYMTGEISEDGVTPQLPAAACPTTTSGTRMSCLDRIKTTYFAAPAERKDIIRPETDNPLAVSAVGTALVSSGLSNPYTENGGILPKPATTATGLDWCNPEPTQFAPAQLGIAGNPTATKGCPLPGAADLGGQNGTRENGPINQSYGLQLAVAWDNPLTNYGKPATLSTRIPAGDGDVSGMKVLDMGAGVNFFDPRNPSRGTQGLWDPEFAEQDFTIALTDADGHEGTVSADDPKYGTALQPSLGSTTSKLHIVLNAIRVPLTEFSAQGVDLTKVRKVEFRFGGEGKPQSGSIQLADVRFQEAVDPVPTPDPAALIAATPRAEASPAIPDVLPIASTTPGKCIDKKAPVATVTSTSVKGRWLTLKGTAADLGCGTSTTRALKAGTVASVQVTITKAVGGGKCLFVKGNGKLSKPMPCTSPLALVAKKTSKWTLKLGGKLAPGPYTSTVRAIDASGNVQSAKGTKLTVR